MSSKLCDKSSNKDGARPYKSRDYANKISSNLHHFKRDGRFCDIDLISGNTKVKVKFLSRHMMSHAENLFGEVAI